jgi:hypothetical protein
MPIPGPSNLQMLKGVNRGLDVADVEWTKLGIFGRGGIESHGINDVFDRFRVASPKRDTPFPVIKTR